MVYNHYLHFIKNGCIDPNNAFIKSVDNFLFSLYFDYLGIIKNDKTKQRNILLVDLFINIKSLLMDGVTDYKQKRMRKKERIRQVEESEDELGKKLLKFIIRDYEEIKNFEYFKSLDELMDKNFYQGIKEFPEMQLDLFLYCILVNTLDKTKGEIFDEIKEKLHLLREKLKSIFSEFDNNKIHKERTFVFPLRSPVGYYDTSFNVRLNDGVEYNYLDILNNEELGEDNKIKMFLDYCSFDNKYSVLSE